MLLRFLVTLWSKFILPKCVFTRTFCFSCVAECCWNTSKCSKVWRERKPTRCNNQMFIINFYLNMFRASLCPSSGEQRQCYCIRCTALVLLDVVGSGCGALRCRMWAVGNWTKDHMTSPPSCFALLLHIYRSRVKFLSLKSGFVA